MKHLRTRAGDARLAVMAKRADFLRAARGARAAAKGLVLHYLDEGGAAGEAPRLEIGFTASRKVGGAVQRNRARRRLREAAREVLARHGKPGALYVLIARPETLVRPFERLKADLRWALARVHGENRSETPS